MFEKLPCFRVKRRKPDGEVYEMEIRSGLFRWIVIIILLLAALASGRPIDLLPLIHSLMHTP